VGWRQQKGMTVKKYQGFHKKKDAGKQEGADMIDEI